jgi:hypothetical protein
MAERLGAFRDGEFQAVSTAPSVNRTPVGPGQVPLPYPVTADLADGLDCAAGVSFHGCPVFTLGSGLPECSGDEAGSGGGVRSRTVGGQVEPADGCRTVFAEGRPIIRDGDPCTMQGGNAEGIFLVRPAPLPRPTGARAEASSDPPIRPETPEEEALWSPGSAPAKVTSDPEVRAVFEAIAQALNSTPVYTSGDREQPVKGGASRSDHLIHRAQDGHIKGRSDAEVFEHLRSNPELVPETGYQVIQHGPHTATQGGHIHIGRAPDDHARYSRPSEFMVEGLSPATRGKYQVVKVARKIGK